MTLLLFKRVLIVIDKMLSYIIVKASTKHVIFKDWYEAHCSKFAVEGGPLT